MKITVSGTTTALRECKAGEQQREPVVEHHQCTMKADFKFWESAVHVLFLQPMNCIPWFVAFPKIPFSTAPHPEVFNAAFWPTGVSPQFTLAAF